MFDFAKIKCILIAETMEKVKEFYESSDFTDGYIVDGAVEGVWALRKLGFRLVIVTARSTTMAQQTESWVRANFPGELNLSRGLQLSYLVGDC